MEGTGQELTPGLHRIEAPLGDRFVACYLVVGDESAVLVDTGLDATPAESIVPYCHKAGIEPESIRWVVVTHCDVDHMGGNASARELLPNAALLGHVEDQALIEDVERLVEERYRQFRDWHGIDIDEAMIDWCREVARAAPLDVIIGAPTTLELGGRSVEIIPTPGHSLGSISLWDPASSAALISDAVLGESLHLGDGSPAFPPTYRYPTPYRETIATIEVLRPRLLLTAHEPAMEAGVASDFLVRSRRFADELENRALRTLRDNRAGMTTRELCDVLAPQMGPWQPDVWTLLAHGLVGHLEELQAGGLVVSDDGPPIRWSAQP